MRIVQFLPVLAYGDAIGNEALSLKKTIKSMGYSTDIYAEVICEQYRNTVATYLSNIKPLKENDIVILHLSTASPIHDIFKKLKCRKIIRYHNVTPAEFFRPFDITYSELNEKAIEEVRELGGYVNYCLADSEFNKSDLIKLGYKCKIDVLPIVLKISDYKQNPSVEIIQKYSDGYTNIVFVGRIAPNKKIEDLIKVFSLYKKHFNQKSRLFLVGSYNENSSYYKSLRTYINDLGAENIIFPGHISFNDVLAYYRLADIFLCMSRHEGFCVPLVEAMLFNVPIIAFDKCAVGETLGGSGILIKDEDPLIFAKAIDYICNDSVLKDKIIEGQTKRLAAFEQKTVEKQFGLYVEKFIKSEKQ